MGLVGGSDVDYPEPEKSWWERKKQRVKERTVSLAIMIPEVALYAWIVLGVLNLSLFTLLIAYFGGFLVSLYSFSFLFKKDNPLPSWLKSLALKLDMMDWFIFEFQVFTTRILLVAFIISCVAALTFVGVGEKLAVVTSLALIALSLPTYLVYYVMSQDDEEEY
ncbi:MAG: hypothetical protein BRD32_00760 [Bacteroidetes bacterium QH_2_64_74]|nr:MAG: hypothetical protein BRD32_00760 [Bacteroidetes bacterium QH_2_64_74]